MLAVRLIFSLPLVQLEADSALPFKGDTLKFSNSQISLRSQSQSAVFSFCLSGTKKKRFITFYICIKMTPGTIRLPRRKGWLEGQRKGEREEEREKEREEGVKREDRI